MIPHHLPFNHYPAIYYRRRELVEALVCAGAPLANQLSWALETRQDELAAWLLAQGADPNDLPLSFQCGDLCLPRAAAEAPGLGLLATPTAFALAVVTGARATLQGMLARGVARKPQILTESPDVYRPDRKLYGIREVAQQTGVLDVLDSAP